MKISEFKYGLDSFTGFTGTLYKIPGVIDNNIYEFFYFTFFIGTEYYGKNTVREKIQQRRPQILDLVDSTLNLS